MSAATCLILMTSVTGEVTDMRCALGNFPKIGEDGKPHTKWKGQPLDANDTAIIELRFKAGGLGVLHTSRWATGHANHPRLEVRLHRCWARSWFDLDRSYDALDTCLGKDRASAKWKTQQLAPAPSIYQRFVRAIQTGAPDQPDLLRGAQIQAYLDACERYASGRWEKGRQHYFTGTVKHLMLVSIRKFDAVVCRSAWKMSIG